MTWTYSGDPSTSDRDAVRFTLGDTVEGMPIFQDEELDFLLNKHRTINKASIAACRAALAKFSREVTYRVGPESVKLGEMYNRFKDLLLELANSSIEAYPLGEFQDSNRRNAIFDIGMMDYGR